MASTQKNKAAELVAIAADIAEQDTCPELAATVSQLVFGEGSPDAELMFIGEAPGKSEDEQGLPFVGAAGKLLNQLLESINLSRDDTYITNIVKYRPPNNRDPSPEEKQAFLPFLWRQISVIQPKLLITLGRHSMECFLPNGRISQLHGQVQQISAPSDSTASGSLCSLLPLYHPAAALYNGGLRQTLFEDFSVIPELLQASNRI